MHFTIFHALCECRYMGHSTSLRRKRQFDSHRLKLKLNSACTVIVWSFLIGDRSALSITECLYISHDPRLAMQNTYVTMYKFAVRPKCNAGGKVSSICTRYFFSKSDACIFLVMEGNLTYPILSAMISSIHLPFKNGQPTTNPSNSLLICT